DADCNSTQLRCVDGVCTFYEDRECYADSDCSTGFKCDSGGHCYRVGSPGGGGGGGGGGGCADADGDGYSNHECGGYDCNDGNANVNPGTNEICGNGVDDDCDGETDMDDSECAGVTCTDTDGDGYGYPGGDSSCLNGPEEDCNDDNKYQHPNQIWFFDRDKDNYTLASGVSMVGCVSPDPLYNLPSEQRLGVDCDDYKNTIHPGAIEVCNLKNDDCDLEVDEGGCPVSPSGSVCNEDYSRKCSPGPPDDTYKHYPPADYGFGCNPPDKYCYIKSGLTCEGGLGDVCMRASCGDPSLHVVAGDPDCQALYSADYFCCNVDPR
ncbi:MAG: putative metal-binding motif-containing protein, partial [Nanoarchaeota archaeon]|nr:putative metal-binding motif-containing protein [Nanoarchaeota archaeon]